MSCIRYTAHPYRQQEGVPDGVAVVEFVAMGVIRESSLVGVSAWLGAFPETILGWTTKARGV